MASGGKHSICSGLVALGTPLAAGVAGLDVAKQVSVDEKDKEFQVIVQ